MNFLVYIFNKELIELLNCLLNDKKGSKSLIDVLGVRKNLLVIESYTTDTV